MGNRSMLGVYAQLPIFTLTRTQCTFAVSVRIRSSIQACQGVCLAWSAHWSRPAYLSVVTARLVGAFRSDTTP
ncbi:hypothetical protein BDP55DRAFT_659174 [Colletotrichum godetiae]|uniref:Uncharacterized protein n=1 Tax=Colletotrichum godetiae TaxID=1209918 RepID=A0AAJ0ANZ1_9PEZI|nr:uncharacterized protein BDP55DRAFT_659174 [Colletotrichum godetiae]KAK1687712.1 hypothetical protein BDP55DRAFT_659174 [Colletotrichum godetiae]